MYYVRSFFSEKTNNDEKKNISSLLIKICKLNFTFDQLIEIFVIVKDNCDNHQINTRKEILDALYFNNKQFFIAVLLLIHDKRIYPESLDNLILKVAPFHVIHFNLRTYSEVMIELIFDLYTYNKFEILYLDPSWEMYCAIKRRIEQYETNKSGKLTKCAIKK